MYGIPHGWGANMLMWNTDVVKPALDSWGAVFDAETRRTAGKITAYDSPIYIADAALYLMKTQPDLGITNPYALTQEQFDAAVDLLKQQTSYIGEYWSDYTKEQTAFDQRRQRRRHDVAGDHEPRSKPTARRSKTVGAQGRVDRLVRHLDDLLQGQASELHVHVDELHHRPKVNAAGGRVVR